MYRSHNLAPTGALVRGEIEGYWLMIHTLQKSRIRTIGRTGKRMGASWLVTKSFFQWQSGVAESCQIEGASDHPPLFCDGTTFFVLFFFIIETGKGARRCRISASKVNPKLHHDHIFKFYIYIFVYIVFHIFLKHSQNIDNIAIRCDQSFPYAKSIGNIQLYKAQLEIENVALEVQC